MTLETYLYVLLPFILSGTVFLYITKHNMLPSLGAPINERLFGKNKTWRGFVLIPVGCALGAVLVTYLEPYMNPLYKFSDYNALFFGFMLGLAYIVSELPNSYMKRRLGIKPGKRAKKHAWLFSLIDQLDSAPLVILVTLIMTDIPLSFMLELVVFGVMVKLTMNYFLYIAKIRKEPV